MRICYSLTLLVGMGIGLAADPNISSEINCKESLVLSVIFLVVMPVWVWLVGKMSILFGNNTLRCRIYSTLGILFVAGLGLGQLVKMFMSGVNIATAFCSSIPFGAFVFGSILGSKLLGRLQAASVNGGDKGMGQ